jgi:hypothetical protein
MFAARRGTAIDLDQEMVWQSRALALTGGLPVRVLEVCPSE